MIFQLVRFFPSCQIILTRIKCIWKDNSLDMQQMKSYSLALLGRNSSFSFASRTIVLSKLYLTKLNNLGRKSNTITFFKLAVYITEIAQYNFYPVKTLFSKLNSLALCVTIKQSSKAKNAGSYYIILTVFFQNILVKFGITHLTHGHWERFRKIMHVCNLSGHVISPYRGSDIRLFVAYIFRKRVSDRVT